MKAKNLIWLAGAVALLAGCQNKHLLPPSNELVVIRAYEQGGGHLREVHVASTLDLGSPDTLGPPIRDAVVHVVRNNVCYELVHLTNGYYGGPTNPYNDRDCPDCGLNLNPGDTLFLEVYYFGKVATAHTVIPPKPVNFVMNANQLDAPSPDQLQPEAEALTLSWDLDGDFWFYVEISNLETYHVPLDGSASIHGYVPPVVSEPFKDKRYIINWGQLQFYGRYRIKVVAVNREYVELILTRNQDSRDLNEPISNVTNGLGIFTAVNNSFIDFKVN